MEKSAPTAPNRPAADRWFYTFANGLLLVLTVAGFQHFYLYGRASPGREITPPIRGLVLTHGALMTIWLLLALAQPWLVAARNVKLHRRLGLFGAGLAIVLVAVGLRIAVASAAVTPPGVMLGPLTPRQFMAVPFLGILLFAALVTLGVRLRADAGWHRPLMFLATLAVCAAGLGRIQSLTDFFVRHGWYGVFGDFCGVVTFGALAVVAHGALTRRFDRRLAAGFAAFAVACTAIAQATTSAGWAAVADVLLR